EETPQSYLASIDDENHISFVYNFSENPEIRPFSLVTYQYEITKESSPGSNSVSSEEFVFYYEDNRHTWQTINNNTPITIHWYQGDQDFGKILLNTAMSSLEKTEEIVPLSIIKPISIYVYPSTTEVQAVIGVSGQTWVAGHSDPDLNLALVSIAPGPELLPSAERQIPHEIMHLRLYQHMGDSYINLPNWLNEGLASMAELYVNPENVNILSLALEENSLIPISALCNSIPQDTARANLAYAQSFSFTKYIFIRYGMQGIQNLLAQYESGASCESGIQNSFGRSLNQLDQQWQQSSFGNNTAQLALNNFLPWFMLMLIILGVPIVTTVANNRISSKFQEKE
ncbi:MAG: peptidase MA family metallohydrolase, partial [Chloroflexota bacterium]